MSYEFEDVDLPGHPLHVSYIDDLFLDQDLDGNFLTSESVGGQLDLAKGAFPDGLP